MASGFLRYVENYDNCSQTPEQFVDIDDDGSYESWELGDPYTGYGLFAQPIDAGLFDGWEDYYYKITPKTVCVFSHNLELLYQTSISDLLNMPDNGKFFIELEKEILYGGDVEHKSAKVNDGIEQL